MLLQQRVGRIKKKERKKTMKKMVKRMAETIVKNWNEANELMAKGFIYSRM